MEFRMGFHWFLLFSLLRIRFQPFESRFSELDDNRFYLVCDKIETVTTHSERDIYPSNLNYRKLY